MYFVFYGLHDTTLQICIISLYECFAYDITVVVKINLFQCQCQCQCHVNFDQWSGDMAVGSCGLVAIHA